MTTERPTVTAEPASGSTPSIHVVRARKLLIGGLIGGVSATLICLIVFAILNGPAGLVSVAMGGGIVLVFYTIGQYVMVRTADAGARTLMIVSLTSYFARFCVIGMFLLLVARRGAGWPDLLPQAVMTSAVAAVIGWLAVEILVFSRLRIGVYDRDYVAPATTGDQQ